LFVLRYLLTSPGTERIFGFLGEMWAGAAGKIIGGGMTYEDVVDANGQVEVVIRADVRSKPARIEVYPSISIISLIEE
jgi:hypothetical protein